MIFYEETLEIWKIRELFALCFLAAVLIIHCDPIRVGKMADQNRINLATLQQRDPYITEILGLAKQVHLYIYKDEWVRSSLLGVS